MQLPLRGITCKLAHQLRDLRRGVQKSSQACRVLADALNSVCFQLAVQLCGGCCAAFHGLSYGICPSTSLRGLPPLQQCNADMQCLTSTDTRGQTCACEDPACQRSRDLTCALSSSETVIFKAKEGVSLCCARGLVMCLHATCLLCRLYMTTAILSQVMVTVSCGCCDKQSRSAASRSGTTHFKPDGSAIDMFVSRWSID